MEDGEPVSNAAPVAPASTPTLASNVTSSASGI